jgi:hypothetical protein
MGSWVHCCSVSGAGSVQAVPMGSTEPVDERQVAVRVRTEVEPPETAHVSEHAPHCPSW